MRNSLFSAAAAALVLFKPIDGAHLCQVLSLQKTKHFRLGIEMAHFEQNTSHSNNSIEIVL